jgi:hypothetical protein
MLHRTIALCILVLPAAAVGGCSSSTAQCHVGADCASGACGSNGQCVAASSSGGGGGGEGGAPPIEAGAEASVEGGVEASAGEGGSSGCKPNNDGTITRDEVPMMPGLHGSFLIAQNVTMNTGGTAQPDGTVDWDFTGALSGDQTVVITTDAPAGQWFSSSFASATYTSRLTIAQPWLGVYQATGGGLLLDGVASTTSGAQQTELSYSPSAEILAVPMQVGSTWTSTSTVQGQLDGVQSYYTEKYDSKVDARGTLKVPFGSFGVLRVQTTLTRTVGAAAQTTQTMTYVAECFGPVARLTSQTTTFPQPVPGTAFTSVAEAWRLTP